MPKKHHYILATAVLLLLFIAYQTATATDYAFQAALPQSDLAKQHYLDIQNVEGRLVAVGERGLIVVSDDNAQSWRQARVPVSLTLTAVHFPNAEHGWAAGHGGVILHSNNAGDSWHVQLDGNDVNSAWLKFSQAELQRRQQALQAADPDTLESEALRQLKQSVEDAEYAVETAQEAVEVGPSDPFLDIHFEDSKNGLAVGAYGMLYQTSDGGLSWQNRANLVNNPWRYHLYAIASASNGTVLISGELGTLLRSSDGGHSWQQLASPYDGSLFGIRSAGNKRFITFGLRGHIFVSDDRGDSWRLLPSNIEDGLFGAVSTPDSTVLISGAGGALVTIDQTARAATAEHHSARQAFSALAFTAAGDLVVAGLGGLLHIEHTDASADE